MHTRTRPESSSQAGSITVLAVFFALVIGGLCVAMVEMGIASRRTQARSDCNLYALEAAEAGTVFAEQEVHAQTDPDGDGIGTLQGTFAGGSFTVTAVQDPDDPLGYQLTATGRHQQMTRRIETGVKLVPGSPWEYGVFTNNQMTWGSAGASTDAYDSRLGTYASQAKNKDGQGWYALSGGTVGSNGAITMSSSSTIRGDASPGPGQSVSLSNGAVVTGSTDPLSEEIDLPPTPFSEFQAAANTNDNGTWTNTGKAPTYNPVTKSISIGSGSVLTLTGKTYFFSSIKLSGGGSIKITNGPVKIYITDEASLGGGAVTNVTNAPINLQIYQYPYALPTGFTPTNNKASLSGGAGAAFVYYGPGTEVQVSGNGGICGAVICNDFYMKGGAMVHFDLALRDQMQGGGNRLKRLYWRDLNPPRR